MRFLSRTTKSNEYQEKADYLAFDISPEHALRLIQRRESAMVYLKSLEEPDGYASSLSEVRLGWSSSLDAFDFCAGDDAPDEIVDLVEIADDGEVWPLPESFVIDEDDCARLGAARLVIDRDGEMRITTYDDYSGHDIDSESFGLALLEEARDTPEPNQCTIT